MGSRTGQFALPQRRPEIRYAQAEILIAGHFPRLLRVDHDRDQNTCFRIEYRNHSPTTPSALSVVAILKAIFEEEAPIKKVFKPLHPVAVKRLVVCRNCSDRVLYVLANARVTVLSPVLTEACEIRAPR